jgi:FkbM family methyltransferase
MSLLGRVIREVEPEQQTGSINLTSEPCAEIGQVLRRILAPGDVFIDVGAKNGVATTLVASAAVGPQGRVLAMEPETRRFARLLQNVSLNRAANTACIPVAASDETIFATLFCEIPSGQVPRPGKSIRVQRVDDLCTKLGFKRVAAVKIDAPGSELLVLRGMEKLLRSKHAPQVICQVSKWPARLLNTWRDGMLGYMADMGYEARPIGTTIIDQVSGMPAYARFVVRFIKIQSPIDGIGADAALARE